MEEKKKHAENDSKLYPLDYINAFVGEQFVRILFLLQQDSLVSLYGVMLV